MRLLYGASYKKRYSVVSDLISQGASVLEICCGCGYLYEGFLKSKRVTYTGMDLIPRLQSRLRKLNVQVINGDVMCLQFPSCDYCIMLGSLYHFKNSEFEIIDKMSRAGATCIILEPVVNLSSARNPILRKIANLLSYVPNTSSSHRLGSNDLAEIFSDRKFDILRNEKVLDDRYQLIEFKRSRHDSK